MTVLLRGVGVMLVAEDAAVLMLVEEDANGLEVAIMLVSDGSDGNEKLTTVTFPAPEEEQLFEIETKNYCNNCTI